MILKNRLVPSLLVSCVWLAGCNGTTNFRSVPIADDTPARNSQDETPDTPKADPSSGASNGTQGQTTDNAGTGSTPIENPSTGEVPAGPGADGSPKYETKDVEETLTQEGLQGFADIALVVDNSSSMQEEQKNLSTKLDDLITALKGANWQIGVITTTVATGSDGQDACNLTLIKSTDSDAQSRFTKAVSAGISGDGNEQGIRQAVNALKCTKKPWVRPGSTVAVLIVSDADNCSDGKGCNGQPWASEQYLIDYVEKDLGRVVGENAGFYGIYSPPSESCSTAEFTANIYQRLIDYKSEGNLNYGNICDSSYKKTLTRISSNIAKLLSSQFSLKQKPDEGTVMISGTKSNGDQITADDFVVTGTTITFKTGSEPALGSKIDIRYKVTVAI